MIWGQQTPTHQKTKGTLRVQNIAPNTAVLIFFFCNIRQNSGGFFVSDCLAQYVTANNTHAFDCDVSDPSGTGEIQLPNVTLYAGGTTVLVSGTLG